MEQTTRTAAIVATTAGATLLLAEAFQRVSYLGEIGGLVTSEVIHGLLLLAIALRSIR